MLKFPILLASHIPNYPIDLEVHINVCCLFPSMVKSTDSNEILLFPPSCIQDDQSNVDQNSNQKVEKQIFLTEDQEV